MAMGAVLTQFQNHAWVPMAFCSKSLNRAQINYAPFDKELFELPTAISHFREYVEGQGVTVRTDHKPLVGAIYKKSDNFSPFQRRHLNRIAQYVDNIEYLKGEHNIVADALSRLENNRFQEIVTTQDDDDELMIPNVKDESDIIANLSEVQV